MPRGFASLTPERRKEIASMGGKASGGNFAKNRAAAVAAGEKGGRLSRGNFKHDRKRAAEAGRKGGRL